MLFLDERVHIGGRYLAEELYVLVRVELGHLTLSCGFGSLLEVNVSSV